MAYDNDAPNGELARHCECAPCLGDTKTQAHQNHGTSWAAEKLLKFNISGVWEKRRTSYGSLAKQFYPFQ